MFKFNISFALRHPVMLIWFSNYFVYTFSETAAVELNNKLCFTELKRVLHFLTL